MIPSQPTKWYAGQADRTNLPPTDKEPRSLGDEWGHGYADGFEAAFAHATTTRRRTVTVRGVLLSLTREGPASAPRESVIAMRLLDLPSNVWRRLPGSMVEVCSPDRDALVYQRDDGVWDLSTCAALVLVLVRKPNRPQAVWPITPLPLRSATPLARCRWRG